MRSNSCTVHSGGVGLGWEGGGGRGARASCTRADTGAGGRAEGRLSWATQAGNRTRLMLCDRQKPATPFNVAPIRALPVLASFLERRLCQTTGGRAAACQLPNMTFAGWAAEPQGGCFCCPHPPTPGLPPESFQRRGVARTVTVKSRRGAWIRCADAGTSGVGGGGCGGGGVEQTRKSSG